jgi:tRNA-dihydrouridine synthase B
MIPLILAPLRGFTDAVFRNAFQRHFQGVDEAVAPFVTSIKGRRIKASHLLDLKPLDNRLMPVVPQILSNHEDEFIRLANTLFDLGYPEINWNLGCPYPMVAKKMRGSGLLPYPDVIDRMLEKILGRFEGRLSIKTRLGRFCADEMDRIIPVFNRYPLARIIVHPRTGVQMYAGTVDLDAFESCLVKISHPVVYNGDIHNLDGYRAMEARFEGVSGWMVGRGVSRQSVSGGNDQTGPPDWSNMQRTVCGISRRSGGRLLAALFRSGTCIGPDERVLAVFFGWICRRPESP